MDLETDLSDSWTVYQHDSKSSDWTYPSYVKVNMISTVQEFWDVHTAIERYIPDNMFFMMRDDIFPSWDDSNNLQGGSISLKIQKADATRTWLSMCIKLTSNTLTKEPDMFDCINGLSISPKANSSIIKIWLKNDSLQTCHAFSLPQWYKGDVLYRNHLDCIHANTTRLAQQQQQLLPAILP